MERLCPKGLHEMTGENSVLGSDGFTRCRACRLVAQRAWRVANPGTSTDGSRRYRQDPEKRERDRERSRRWKALNRERNRARDREYQARRRAALSHDLSAEAERDA